MTLNFSNSDGRVPTQVLSAEAAPLDSFHDCYVHGLRWSQRQFLFAVDLDYIVEWILPSEALAAYRFRVSSGSLVFADASGVKANLDWSGAGLEAQISSLWLDGERTTPNGSKQHRYVIDFSDVDGSISLWATAYEVLLWTEPEMVDTPYLQSVG